MTNHGDNSGSNRLLERIKDWINMYRGGFGSGFVNIFVFFIVVTNERIILELLEKSEIFEDII